VIKLAADIEPYFVDYGILLGVDIVLLVLCFQHYPTLLPSGDEMIGLASALDLELGEIGKIKI
jgi:hypothetical protein